MEYQDFEIEITTPNEGTHQVNVLRTPAGETRQQIAFGLNDDTLRDKLSQVEQTLRYKEKRTAEQKREQQRDMKAFGSLLFNALITDNLKSLYDQSRLICKQSEQGLRLKLRIQSPLLAAVPWELLYDSRFDEFLTTSRQVSVVRYAALPRVARQMATRPPLNVLGVVSAPSNLPPLDVAFEKQQVEMALRPLINKGLATLTWLDEANSRVLLRTMNRGPWHVLHYVGHSDFDVEADEGYLSLVDRQGAEERLSADKLGMLLADHGTLRLVFLNSCRGARVGQDIYRGMATTLVRRGIPAVIGMQYDISDAAALELAQTFYETLAENMSIETALAEARKAISLTVDESAEWGTPVFYTHAPESVLFDMPAPTAMVDQNVLAPVPMPMLPTNHKTTSQGDETMSDAPGSTMALLETIKARYNDSELRTLCLALGVDYEDLAGAARVDKIRELVLYCQRHGLTAQLQEKLAAQKQRVPVAEVQANVDIDTWVAALEQSPTMQDRDARQAVFAELPAPIRNNLNTHLPTLIAQLRNLVKTCQNYPDGLSSLVQAIRTLEGNSLAVQQLETLL